MSPQDITLLGAVVAMALGLVETIKAISLRVTEGDRKKNGFGHEDRARLIQLIERQQADREVLIIHIKRLTDRIEQNTEEVTDLVRAIREQTIRRT